MTTSPTEPNRFSFTGTALPLAFFTVFFLANGILGYFTIRNIEENQDQVILSLRNINSINEIHSEILRAETGQRGYLLTDLESYITPYSQARQIIDEKLSIFASSPLDNVQQTYLYELQLLVDEKLTEMDETIELVMDNRSTEAIQQVFSHRGRNIMTEITSVINQMIRYEDELLVQRQEATRNSRSTSFYIILTANLVGLVMVFVTVSLVRKYINKEHEFTQALKETNDTLESKVEERTAALSHYSNELKRSNRELQDFAFVASHDLQEPLRKIRAFGDRLASNYREVLDEQGQDYLGRMQKASARMSTLIEDLLSFSRITTKAEPFVTISLYDVVAEVLEDLEFSIEEANARVLVEPLPEIEADRSQMKQLLQNLIANAVKFRHPDVAPIIKLQSRLLTPTNSANDGQTEWVEIRVGDNGIGFDQEFANRIFTPFQRLHGRHEYSGTGIGLAVCRRIVERHGGTISAQSAPGEGSTFTIALPLKNVSFDLEGNSLNGKK